MATTIQSIDFDAADRLQSFVQTKVKKLQHFYDQIIDAQVYLKLEKNKNKDIGNKIVEIKLLVPNNTLIASHQAKTFEEATNMCVEQIKRQIIRHKEKERGPVDPSGKVFNLNTEVQD